MILPRCRHIYSKSTEDECVKNQFVGRINSLYYYYYYSGHELSMRASMCVRACVRVCVSAPVRVG